MSAESSRPTNGASSGPARSGAYDPDRSARSRLSFPLPDVSWEIARPYWEGAAAGELRLSFCSDCGRVNWYPKGECRVCHGGRFAWRAVNGTGSLFSYSVVRHPFLKQYADLLPMVPALVELDDVPGIRIVTRIVDCDPSALACELPVEVVFRPLRFAGVDGEVVAPLFRLRD